jgi:two-component system LytT family sensor kinase
MQRRTAPLAKAGAPLYIAAMATDSATLERRMARPRRVSDSPKIQSPADPIARGMGLDRPFFDDKNRAFWILQTIGWSGYFFLRSLSGFAN